MYNTNLYSLFYINAHSSSLENLASIAVDFEWKLLECKISKSNLWNISQASRYNSVIAESSLGIFGAFAPQLRFLPLIFVKLVQIWYQSVAVEGWTELEYKCCPGPKLLNAVKTTADVKCGLIKIWHDRAVDTITVLDTGLIKYWTSHKSSPWRGQCRSLGLVRGVWTF